MNYHIIGKNVHHWLTHMPAVGYGIVFHSVVNGFTQIKLTAVHFITRELFLASVAACDKTPALPPNLIIQGTV